MRAAIPRVMLNLGTPTRDHLTMDELDRLYRRLVHNIRVGFPELLTRPFEVSAIYQQVVPYRTNRRELDFASNDEYELALCQVLSGARGLLNVEPEVQEALRRELDAPNPDLAAYRAYATSLVSLATEPLRDLMLRVTPDSLRAGSANAASPSEQVAIAGRTTEAFETPPSAELEAIEPPPPPPPPAPVPPSASRSPGSRTATTRTTGGEPLSPSLPLSRPVPVKLAHGGNCRYCGTSLPEGRGVMFCPSCGHNVTVQHCPACNTELEVDWKFCITCGRDVAPGG